MTIIDTIADAHYGDRIAMAMAFAELLNEEARELAAIGVDVIQFDEPAFNVYLDEVVAWGIAALHRAVEGLGCTTAVHICYGYGIQANIEWKAGLGARVAAIRAAFSRRSLRAGSTRSRWNAPIRGSRSNCLVCSTARMCWSARSTSRASETETPEQVAATIEAALRYVPAERLYPCTNCGMAPLISGLAERKLAALTAGAALVRGRR